MLNQHINIESTDPYLAFGKCLTRGIINLVIIAVPMMDFMNHSGSEDVSIHVLQDGEGGTVAMHSSAAVGIDGEVLNNYGTTKSNEELLAMYGFAEVSSVFYVKHPCACACEHTELPAYRHVWLHDVHSSTPRGVRAHTHAQTHTDRYLSQKNNND